MPLQVYVVGAGGHSKVVVATLEANGHSIARVFNRDDDAKRELPEAARCVIAVGDNRTRKRIADDLEGRVEWLTVVHPNADVHPTVQLGPGTVVVSGAVIQPDATIGAHAIVNTGATIDHDCVLSDFVHVAPGCHLSGSVTLEEGVLMGVASAAIPGARVGAWATVGAGATVVKDLPEGVVAIGTPAAVVED